MTAYESWGRYPRVRHAGAIPIWWRDDVPDLSRVDGSVLPFGRGRSYGDTCLNEGGVLLDTRHLSRFLAFDTRSGLLRCEAGVTLEEILQVAVPHGWFLPVTPGTKFVTVGGAIAHDVHGKNHHSGGTFGRHVPRFELLRSDGTRLTCSSVEHAAEYQATIGGMGLTGLILWAEVQLLAVPGPWLDVETVPFANLEEFFAVSSRSDQDFAYTVSWVDCLSRGRSLGRGILFRGNHAETPASAAGRRFARRSWRLPIDLPGALLNHTTVKLFNSVYYANHSARAGRRIVHYEPFFYPLDAIHDWNRLYGKRGFLQYQFVVPATDGHVALRDILTAIASRGEGSFLAVMKEFGAIRSPGMLSFPRAGVTVALDFPFRGNRTLDFLDQLDLMVASAGGAVYAAKDARMSATHFQRAFPCWREFGGLKDERFSSSFWRRVAQAERAV